MNHLLFVFKALFSRRWIVPTMVVVAGMLLLARLGIWQLDRLDQRRAANAQLVTALNQSAVQLPADSLPSDLSSFKNRDVLVSGTYDFEHEGMLILQSWGRRSGVHLLTPLVFEGGETAVLVNRGWIPDAEANEEDRLSYQTSGTVTVHGYIALTQTLEREGIADGSPVRNEGEWYRVDVQAFAAQTSYELYPFFIVESPPEEVQTDLPYKITKDVDLSEGSHFSYALQWFTFSLLLSVIYIVYVNQAVQKE
jgi:surfeit locus 1 family protein